ncbi:MAG: hypothetical protein VCA55_07120 [Verrucomicrobiales bacterium]
MPPCADESAAAGFYESVLAQGEDTPGMNPNLLSPGPCSSGESSVMEGSLPPAQRDSATSTTPGDSQSASSVTEPFWKTHSEIAPSIPAPFSTDASDVSAEAHRAPARESPDEITVPSAGETPFHAAGSIPGNLQVEDTGFSGVVEDNVVSEQDVPFPSRAPDELAEPSAFPPRPTGVAGTPEIGGQEQLPAFSEKPDSPQDGGSVFGNRNKVPDSPETGGTSFPGDGGLSSGRQSGEESLSETDPGMPHIPGFSPSEQQGIQEPRPDSFEPEQLPVPTELSSVAKGNPVDGEKELSVAGPWPFEDGFVQPKVHAKQPEPLESLSPLSPILPGSQNPFDPAGESKAVQDKHPPSSDCNFGSSTGQVTLRAILMTDGDIDGDMVVRHCAGLEGVHQCVVYTADGRIKSSSMPDGILEIDAAGLLESVRTLASAFRAGSEGPVTLRSPEGLVSFFSCGDACLGVLHSEGAFKSGVQERFRLITGALGSLTA